MSNTDIINKAKKRADEILSKMTLTEKIGQISQFGTSIYNDEKHYFEDHFAEGKIGSYLSVVGAELTNSIQKRVIDETPNHIPVIFADDVIHGFKTAMPTPLAMSCGWNTENIELACAVAAKEAYASGVRWTFAPMVDIARDPRWGRIVEGYGEDPYLTSRMSEAAVKGYQGDELGTENHLFACLKHFAAYGACEGGRDYNSVDMSYQKLHDVYLPPFAAGLKAGAMSVMTAFNDFNGIPCSANRYMLQSVLREELGFKGTIISDFNSVDDMVNHGYSPDHSTAYCDAFSAGVDVLMSGNPDGYNNNLPDALKDGQITVSQIDDSVRRVLVMKIIAGLLEKPFTNTENESCHGSPEHRAVSRKVGRESIVLLENNGVLPLKEKKKIALIGPLADSDLDVLGPWCGHPDKDDTVTVKDGIESVFGTENVCYAKGCDIEGGNDDGFDAALEAAEKSEIIIAVVGESIEMGGEAKNRSDLRLPGLQEKLLLRLIEIKKPIIVLVSAGRPLVLTEFYNKVDALVYIWQLGTETGNAVADVLTGEYNPAGHLTTSFPRAVGQIPVFYNYFSTGKPPLDKVWYESKYLDVPITPLYPFGYGKSYTRFELSDLKLSNEVIRSDGKLTASCKVKNVGQYDGETVVQLYVRDLFASRVRPICELKGYKKVFLNKGCERIVEIELAAESLGFYDWDNKYIVEAGEFMLWLAENSSDKHLEKRFGVEK